MKKRFPLRKRYYIYCILLGYLVGAVMSPFIARADNVMVVSPEEQTVDAGSSFNVSIWLFPDTYVKSWEFKILFDKDLLEATSVSEGDFFVGYVTFFMPGEIDNVNGTIINIYSLIVGKGNVTENGTLVKISFKAKNLSGESKIRFYDQGITNESKYLPLNVTNGTVMVTGGMEEARSWLIKAFGYATFGNVSEEDPGPDVPPNEGPAPAPPEDTGEPAWQDIFVAVVLILLVFGVIICKSIF